MTNACVLPAGGTFIIAVAGVAQDVVHRDGVADEDQARGDRAAIGAGMTIRGSRQMAPADAGKSRGSRFVVTRRILGSSGSSRSRLVIAWMPGVRATTETRPAPGAWTTKAASAAGDQVVAAAEAPAAELGPGESRRSARGRRSRAG